jgi:equilibrative nucleoside transporter 1/2/3
MRFSYFLALHSDSILYASFVVIGAGVLLPWNAFIMALDYFKLLYPDIPFAFLLPIIYDFFTVLFFILSIFFAHHYSQRLRMLAFLAFDFVALIIVPIFAIATSANVSLFFTFASVAVTGASTAILQGTSIAVGSLLGLRYVNGIMIGQGVAGIVIAIVRIITKAVLPDTLDGYFLSGIAYFAIAGFCILLSIGAYLIIEFLSVRSKERESTSAFNDAMSIQNEPEPPSSRLLEDKGHQEGGNVRILSTFKKIWRESVATYLFYIVTISLFPGLTNRIESTSPSLGDWFMVITSTTFMIFDFIGRSLPSFDFIPKGYSHLILQATIRFIFFPAFFLAIFKTISSDFYSISVMILFSLSNGFCGTVSMAAGTLRVNPNEKQMVCNSFFSNFNLTGQ